MGEIDNVEKLYEILDKLKGNLINIYIHNGYLCTSINMILGEYSTGKLQQTHSKRNYITKNMLHLCPGESDKGEQYATISIEYLECKIVARFVENMDIYQLEFLYRDNSRVTISHKIEE